ncbi:hypothetical protein MANES_05G186751v8 [Manihot esculenta]|uniref:Uncharacterized protein n=3 Tax=Manihot esculenta TaxID=3983 RepID=A0ACB7HPD2_MANES|nr:hypothetical protein MANES_05G186751v8 [Manihot esculenta]KAG8654384.1 hypothetical protein MANES_05G186751v8 [Manihot esculenta]KAG8654385.1 hypothetical protein MANES_05G186751v8 [Manihot esculenta]
MLYLFIVLYVILNIFFSFTSLYCQAKFITRRSCIYFFSFLKGSFFFLESKSTLQAYSYPTRLINL